MATFSIRLVQQITEQGSGDFTIEDSNLVKLTDGQVHLIERETVLDRSVSFKLLDEGGAEVRSVTASGGQSA